MCIYCIARGVVIFCVVSMTLTCEWMKSTCFVFKLKRKKQVLALVLIEDLGFLPRVWEIPSFHEWSVAERVERRWISLTSGRNPRSSIGTRVRSYYSFVLFSFGHCIVCPSLIYGALNTSLVSSSFSFNTFNNNINIQQQINVYKTQRNSKCPTMWMWNYKDHTNITWHLYKWSNLIIWTTNIW